MYCCLYSEKTPDDGQRNCPKHAEFYSNNKFEKLVHLVSFTTVIVHLCRLLALYDLINETDIHLKQQLVKWHILQKSISGYVTL